MAETRVKAAYEVLLIGGSAGALGVIIDILQELDQVPFAVIVVIHRRGSADDTLTDLLAARSRLPVKEAEEKEPVVPGIVYLAPPDYHLLIEKDGSFSLDASEKVHFSRPSIDVTFESAAGVYGDRTAAVLLSGGNQDGGEGLYSIFRAGGYCMVQDPETADVPYMPGFAISRFTPQAVVAKEGLPGAIRGL